MRLAVLAAPESWYLKDLLRAAAGVHEVQPVTFRQLRSALDRTAMAAASGEVDLRTVDGLLVRTMPPGSLEQVVFRMDVLARLEAAGQRIVNPPRAIEAAVDKYLASARLQAAGLRVPRTFVCQTADDALAGFAWLGGDAVLKPLFGAEGRGITRLVDEALAWRAFKLLEELRAVIYLQEYIPHEGFDVRVLVIGERLRAMRRRNPLDWRTNISRGATAEPLELSAELAELARRAAAAVGAPLAGVDLLPGRDGHIYTIEVNAVPGWKALAAACEIDVAALVLDELQRMTEAAPGRAGGAPRSGSQHCASSTGGQATSGTAQTANEAPEAR